MLNTASLIRVSDSIDIPVTQLSVSLDWDSWCWTLSASVPTRAAAARVPAYPGKVRATINGFAWDFIVDEVSWNRAFATYSATLKGRSPAAIYAEPYALAKTYREAEAKTAEQLALPLQASPEGAGLLLPGTTFDFIDGEEDGFRGVVSGVSISAGWNDVKQTLEILAP